MLVRFPAVFLLAVVTVVLVRKSGLKPSHALACVLLGFYLAGSSAEPTIDELARRIAELLPQLRL